MLVLWLVITASVVAAGAVSGYRAAALPESVLMSALGPAYSAYCARTKRLVPGMV